MKNVLFDFLFIFLIVYLVYLLFIKRRKKNYELLKNDDFIKLFIKRYDIDVKKINYKLLLNIISLINSFVIALTSTIILRIDSIIWSIIVAFVVLFALVFILFGAAGKYFKKSEGKTKVKVKKRKSKKEDEE